MVIDKISNIANVQKIATQNQVAKATEKAISPTVQDTVSISAEALKAQETHKAQQTVKSAPDSRAEKIKEVKGKLANGEYDNISTEMLERVAENIASSLIRS